MVTVPVGAAAPMGGGVGSGVTTGEVSTGGAGDLGAAKASGAATRIKAMAPPNARGPILSQSLKAACNINIGRRSLITP
jgi:hypothetical protein